MIRYPSPCLPARNSPIITPTSANPIFVFAIDRKVGRLPGNTTLVKACNLLPPNVSINFNLSGSVCINTWYRFSIHPNIPTDIPQSMIVFGPVPSHTIISGASADFGRLFNTIRNGSKVCPRPGRNQNRVASISEKVTISRKLTTDSHSVIPICRNSDISCKSCKNSIPIALGELK